MKQTIQIIALCYLCVSFISCKAQSSKPETVSNQSNSNKIVGGGCDGCEIMYVGMPDNLLPVDTSDGWKEKGQKLLITGKVLKIDGKTPAANVIIYYWHTDQNGYYAPNDIMDERAKRHGHLRGWIKTDEEGNYSIYTIRPASYPNDNIPAHIHISIKEPNIDNEYYIDDLIFDDDKLLTGANRKTLVNRGGSGILRLVKKDDTHIAEHNIILGLNIPNYPEKNNNELNSGLQIGEDHPSFIPYHAFGPDKGTRTCPVCKYGRFHGIVYYVGNHPNWEDIKKWLIFLDQESVRRSQYLKAYFVYGNEIGYSKISRQKELENIGLELKLKKIALTYVPSMRDAETEVNLIEINPEVDNTIMIYKYRNIVDKFVNFKASPENFQKISATLDKTRGDYFDLPEPRHQ